jgi:Leucine-rich repeat (LRR) protein
MKIKKDRECIKLPHLKIRELIILPTVNLVELHCNRANQLSFLPKMPPTLKYLDCSENQLTSLPELSTTQLHTLLCNYNKLIELPRLPKTITEINCSNNQLSSLSNVRETILKTLICNNNQLQILPQFPPTLDEINFNSNLVKQFPKIYNAKYIRCKHNLISTITQISNSLIILECSNNYIKFIKYLPCNLQKLYCSYNLLKKIPYQPNSLIELNCMGNQITDLFYLSDNLERLNCSYNLLKKIPTLPRFLYVLECNNNLIQSLPTFPVHLNILNCSNNHIKSIPTLPPSVSEVIMHNSVIIYPLIHHDTRIKVDYHLSNELKHMYRYSLFSTTYLLDYMGYNEFIKGYNMKSLYLINKYGHKLFYKILKKRMDRIRDELLYKYSIILYHPSRMERLLNQGDDIFYDN